MRLLLASRGTTAPACVRRGRTSMRALGALLGLAVLAGSAGCRERKEAEASVPTQAAQTLTELYKELATHNHLALLPDGRYFEVLPQHGLVQEDRTLCERHPLNCGTYTRRGQEVYLEPTSPDAGGRRILRVDEYGDILGFQKRYQRLHPGDGVRLDGAYERYWSRRSDATKYGTIRFTPDGRFTERGLLSAIQWDGGLAADPRGLGYPRPVGYPHYDRRGGATRRRGDVHHPTQHARVALRGRTRRADRILRARRGPRARRTEVHVPERMDHGPHALRGALLWFARSQQLRKLVSDASRTRSRQAAAHALLDRSCAAERCAACSPTRTGAAWCTRTQAWHSSTPSTLAEFLRCARGSTRGAAPLALPSTARRLP